MAKGPVPTPAPDVVRPPMPSEAPAPDVVNIPEPAPDWEPSPLPSMIPHETPQEVPKDVPPIGRASLNDCASSIGGRGVIAGAAS
jgi:hypothetical protein